MNEPFTMTTAEAARQIGVTVSTISRWVSNGDKELPAQKTPGGWMLFRPSDVAEKARKWNADHGGDAA